MFALLFACAADPAQDTQTGDVAAGVAPEGYSAMYLQIADGLVDPTDPAAFVPPDQAWEQEIGEGYGEWRQAGLDWFSSEFGMDLSDPENADRLYLIESAVPVDADYRVVWSTEGPVPAEGLRVVDIAMGAFVSDPAGFELGGAWAGTLAPAGTGVTWGVYKIEEEQGDQVAPFRSKAPGTGNGTVFAFECIIEHPRLGVATGGVYTNIYQTADGMIQYDVRNTIALPLRD